MVTSTVVDFNSSSAGRDYCCRVTCSCCATQRERQLKGFLSLHFSVRQQGVRNGSTCLIRVEGDGFRLAIR